MRTKELRIFVYEYASVDELSEADRQLVIAAREAAGDAYAPYSRFCVGAAVRLENGVIIKGNNQENAAYPIGLCAERVALFYANANNPGLAVDALAITALKHGELVVEPVKPCGSCRQAMMEVECRFQKPFRIILDGRSRLQVFDGADSLLPFAFRPESLD